MLDQISVYLYEKVYYYICKLYLMHKSDVFFYSKENSKVEQVQ